VEVYTYYCPSRSLSAPPGVPPAAVPEGVGRVRPSSALLRLGAAGRRPGVAAAGAGVLTHRTPGQTSSSLTRW